MSLTVTQRPYQTINGEISKWNAVRNPILYKFQRKDRTYSQINDNGGNIQIQFNSVDVSLEYEIDDYIYLVSDNGTYDVIAQVTASAFSVNTLVTVNSAYLGASTSGFINNNTYVTGYNIETELYNSSDELIGTKSNSANSRGVIICDVSIMLKSQLVQDNDADLTLSSETYDDSNVYTGFYIKFTEVYTGSAEAQTDDSDNIFFAIGGAMQIPSTYGGNIYEYLILGDMKIAEVTIPTASILTGFASPVTIIAAPGAGKIIWPICFFDSLDYNSVAYATNVDYHYEINGVDVSGTITSILDAAADKISLTKVQDLRELTTLINKALVWKANTGNPTAGDSPLYSKILYTIIDFV